MRPEQPRFKLNALRRRNELLCRIDLWGFVSVMLAILVWTRFGLPHPPHAFGSNADRAIAVHSSPQPGAQKEDAMLISITRDGTVFFRDHRVLRPELANEIREAVRNGAEKKVYMVVDARAKYGDATPVFAQIRLAGIENVGFLTEKPYP
jgi:biopolymer transport protein ExbD